MPLAFPPPSPRLAIYFPSFRTAPRRGTSWLLRSAASTPRKETSARRIAGEEAIKVAVTPAIVGESMNSAARKCATRVPHASRSCSGLEPRGKKPDDGLTRCTDSEPRGRALQRDTSSARAQCTSSLRVNKRDAAMRSAASASGSPSRTYS